VAGVREQVIDQVRGILRVGHAPVELRRIVGRADGHERRVVHVGEHGETVRGKRLGEHHVERPAALDQRPDPRVFERGLAHPVVHFAQAPQSGYRVHGPRRRRFGRHVQPADDGRQRVRHVHVHVTVARATAAAFPPRKRTDHGDVVTAFGQRDQQRFDHDEVTVTVVREHGQHFGAVRCGRPRRQHRHGRHQAGRRHRCCTHFVR